MHQSRVEIKPVLGSISPTFSINYPFQVLMRRFQNILNNAISSSWILGYFKCSKYYGCRIYQIATPQGSNHLLSVKRIKIDSSLLISRFTFILT